VVQKCESSKNGCGWVFFLKTDVDGLKMDEGGLKTDVGVKKSVDGFEASKPGGW
jgi:hypothetical protein